MKEIKLSESKDKNLPETQEQSVALSPYDTTRISYSGLLAIQGRILEECKTELRFPQCVQTFKTMAKDATISPALDYVESLMAQVPWRVKIPEGYENTLKDKALYLTQCMNDMEDQTWRQFIKSVSTFHRFGFGLHEIVLRERRDTEGSRYNDGLVGIKCLPQLSQDSILSWEYKPDGKELDGIKQTIYKPQGTEVKAYTPDEFKLDQFVFIKKEKLLHFKNTSTKTNPEGASPLVGCYLAWKYKSELEKYQAMGIAGDVRGLKALYIPQQYMSSNASDEDKETYEHFKKVIQGLQLGEQSGIILPNVHDEKGNKLFELDVLSVMGQKAYDVTTIIQNYRNEILSSLAATQLGLGQGGSGSFSLAETLQDITNVVVKSRLVEIQDVINHNLVRKLFELNGWDTTVMPEIVFGDLVKPSLDDLGKFVQRVGSQGLLSRKPETVNWIAEQAGMPTPFPDTSIPIEEAEKQLTGYSSNSGEGMEEGLPSGTGSAAGGGDQTTGNKEDGG